MGLADLCMGSDRVPISSFPVPVMLPATFRYVLVSFLNVKVPSILKLARPVDRLLWSASKTTMWSDWIVTLSPFPGTPVGFHVLLDDQFPLPVLV